MIRYALADKLRARGALGFAQDAAIMIGQCAFWGALIGAGLVTVTVVGVPLVLVDKVFDLLAGGPSRPEAGCANRSSYEPTEDTLPAVPRGHCGRCDRCGWPFSTDRASIGCKPSDCSMRPLPALERTCPGCGAPYENSSAGRSA